MAARTSASTSVQPISATIGRDVEHGALIGGHVVEREHADERLDERLGDVEDEADDVIARVGDEQEQDDPQDQQRLEHAERKGDDTGRDRGAAGAGRHVGALGRPDAVGGGAGARYGSTRGSTVRVSWVVVCW